MLALWANRWARGDFDTSFGAVLVMSRLIPIYKDWDTNDVRPVASGSAVRRLLGRAFAEKVEGLTNDLQLGLKKAGYEIGIHSHVIWRVKVVCQEWSFCCLILISLFIAFIEHC